MPFLYWSIWVLFSAPYEATLKEEAHALQCTAAGPYNGFPPIYHVLALRGLGPDILRIHNSCASQSFPHCTDFAWRHVPLALDLPLVCHVSFAMVCVPHNVFISRENNRDVELDVRMNPTPSRTTTNVLCCTISSPRFNFLASVWRHATTQPRRGHLLHDLTTQVFLRSL